MPSNFILVVTSDTTDVKPPLPTTVCNYLAKFITEKILLTKHIILKSSWSVMVGMVFSSHAAPGSDSIILKPKVRTVMALHARLYEIMIPLKREGKMNASVEVMLDLLWEGLTLFFTSTYKKVTIQFMGELKKQLNMSYLATLSKGNS